MDNSILIVKAAAELRVPILSLVNMNSDGVIKFDSIDVVNVESIALAKKKDLSQYRKISMLPTTPTKCIKVACNHGHRDYSKAKTGVICSNPAKNKYSEIPATCLYMDEIGIMRDYLNQE